MLTIWGRKNSSNVMPVMWALGELGLAHERKDVGGSFGGLGDPAFRAINPNGRIPVLQDDDFVLFESNAILRHLARSHGKGSLLPDDLHDLALADQWLDWHKTTLSEPMTALFWGTVRTEPAMRDAGAVAKAADATAKTLSILEAHLKGRSFMVADRLTLADLPLGTLINRYLRLPIDRPDFPGIQA